MGEGSKEFVKVDGGNTWLIDAECCAAEVLMHGD